MPLSSKQQLNNHGKPFKYSVGNNTHKGGQNNLKFEIKLDKKLTEFELEEISQIIKDNYKITNFEVKLAPRGFIAQTFFINSKEGFLLKIIPKERIDKNFNKVLASISELVKLGVDNITTIFPDNKENLYLDLGEAVAVLFRKIDADWILPQDLTDEQNLAVLDSLKKIQKYTDKLTNLPTEEFDFEKHLTIKDLIDKLKSEKQLKQKEMLLKITLEPYFNFIEKQITLFESILERIEPEIPKTKYVITHGDAPGNILVNGQKIYIIDWDGLLLAPIERDAVLVKNKYLDYFMDNNKINPTLFNFYSLQRYFDDMHDFMIEIFRPDCNIKKVQSWLEEMNEECLNKDSWLVDLLTRAVALLEKNFY